MIIPINKIPNATPKNKLTYTEFLKTTSVIRMLYGKDEATRYFTNNIDVYYNIDND